ncbi:GH25 family lysozyme [Streptomyces sp. NPDC006733]|uniref:GH25 family lysozyme n=1 Tax=Streptomyces sp. NPDC006733 TaxID=3155460 RepID=UPI0033E8DCBD
MPCDEQDAWIRYARSRAPGHRVIFYCNKDYWFNRDTTSFAGDGLWIATGGLPAGSPGVKHPWLVHQYSSADDIDHNVARFTSRAAMETWAVGTTRTGLTPEGIRAVAAAVWNHRITSTRDKLPQDAATYVAASDGHLAELLEALAAGARRSKHWPPR